jgi:hypothetical protein
MDQINPSTAYQNYPVQPTEAAKVEAYQAAQYLASEYQPQQQYVATDVPNGEPQDAEDAAATNKVVGMIVICATAVCMFLLGWVMSDIWAGRWSKSSRSGDVASDSDISNGTVWGLTVWSVCKFLIIAVIGPGMFTHGYGSLMEQLPEDSILHRMRIHGTLDGYVHAISYILLPLGVELIRSANTPANGSCFYESRNTYMPVKSKADLSALIEDFFISGSLMFSTCMFVRQMPYWNIPLSIPGFVGMGISGVAVCLTGILAGMCWEATLLRWLFLPLGIACTMLWIPRFKEHLLAGSIPIWVVFFTYLLVNYFTWSIPVDQMCHALPCAAAKKNV